MNLSSHRISEEDMYLDWINNFLTIDCFAEHYNLTTEQAKELINKYTHEK